MMIVLFFVIDNIDVFIHHIIFEQSDKDTFVPLSNKNKFQYTRKTLHRSMSNIPRFYH